MIFLPQHAVAIELTAEQKKIYNPTGRKLPRFASLSKKTTNVRTGPGQHYPIKWVVDQAKLPVEIILEFENWRKIKDHEGQEGWVYHTLLSGKRMGFIMGDEPVSAYTKSFSATDSYPAISMRLEPMSLVKVRACDQNLCKVITSGYSGWIEKKSLWGVYEYENID